MDGRKQPLVEVVEHDDVGRLRGRAVDREEAVDAAAGERERRGSESDRLGVRNPDRQLVVPGGTANNELELATFTRSGWTELIGVPTGSKKKSSAANCPAPFITRKRP